VPAFALYFLCGLALIAIASAIFVRLTPFPEMQLIAQGNQAAAWVFAGTVLGFALPVSSAIAHSVSMADMLSWTTLGLLFQYLAHLAIRALLPGFVQGIRDGVTALGIASAGLSVAVGIVNAASLVF
jgi:putative membrane protein